MKPFINPIRPFIVHSDGPKKGQEVEQKSPPVRGVDYDVGSPFGEPIVEPICPLIVTPPRTAEGEDLGLQASSKLAENELPIRGIDLSQEAFLG